MALLTSVLSALAPYIVDMIIDIIKAEADPKLDTGYKKHNHVIKQLGNNIGDKLDDFENRDIMDVANQKIHETVSKLNEAGTFVKGADDAP